MRKYVAVCALLAGCAIGGSDELQTATVQNIGLQANAAVPPLGEGVSPATGIGGEGAAVVTRVGGWSSGPGAVTWHGGQWVMAYQPRPGQTLANVSCDVWNPTTAAPATVLVEVVSSNGQVLGTASAPASTSVTFRLWPFVGSHVFVDGEQAIVRISPRDATTGAWTSAVQDTTVIGCAVSASWPTPSLPAVTYTTVPSRLFSAPDITVGVNGQVYALPLSAGSVTAISISAQCTSAGFIFGCARIHERGTWDWCASPHACVGAGETSVPLSAPIQVSPTTHIDIALMSGPSVATSPFAIYTSQ